MRHRLGPLDGEGRMRTKQYRVVLDDAERAQLLLLTRQGRAAARTVLRAHVLLRANEDAFDDDTAEALHTSVNTVQRVRRRFAEGGLDAALYDRPRPGATPKLDAKGEAHLVALACSKPPDGRAVWTMQLLADRLVELHVIADISDETIRRTLGKKPAQAVAGGALVHRAGGRRLRLAHGGRAGPLRRGGRRA
jgi:transposase